MRRALTSLALFLATAACTAADPSGPMRPAMVAPVLTTADARDSQT